MVFIKAYWKLILIGITTLLILIWIGSATGTSIKLWNMLVDQIRTDQSKVVKILEQTVTERELEIADLERQVEANRQQQFQVRAENDRLKGSIRELQIKREAVVVSGDPDRIVDELHRLGFQSAGRIPGPGR